MDALLGMLAPGVVFHGDGRRFCAGVRFEPLEEITGLWPGTPCLITIKTFGWQPAPARQAPADLN